MFNDFPIIICCSGNSIPFDNKEGVDSRLKDIIENNISMGCNYFDFYGCNTTLLTFVDASQTSNFYKKNMNWLVNIPLIIGRHSVMAEKTQTDNTLLIPPSRYYLGKEALDTKYKRCFSCKKVYKLNDKNRTCEKCKCKLWNIGIFPSHLVSMFTLGLAIGLGFTEIYLLGSDCCEIDGKTHFYQDLINPEEIGNNKKFSGIGKKYHNNEKKMIYRTNTYTDIKKLNEGSNRFGAFKNYKNEGLQIFNVSTLSKINVFPKLTYPEFYKKIGNRHLNQSIIRERIKKYILDRCF